MADTYVTCTVSPCTVIYQIDLPPFNLTTEEGAVIAGAILAIWAIGFGFRAVIQALSIGGNSKTESE